MYRTISKLLLFFWLVIVCSLVLSASEASVSNEAVPITLIVTENGSSLYTKPKAFDDAIICALDSALRGHIPVITSPTVLYWLSKKACWLRQLEGEYQAYLNNDGDLVVLLPYATMVTPTAMGLDESCLQKPLTTPSTMRAEFAQQQYAQQPVNIEHIKKLFRLETSCATTPIKYWYILGHGSDAIGEKDFPSWGQARIAAFDLPAFVNILMTLNKLNTGGAYVVSCYGTGTNLLTVQALLHGAITDERCVPIEPLRFPLIVQGSTDTVTSLTMGKYCSCEKFFTVLQQCASCCFGRTEAQEAWNALMAMVPVSERAINYPVLRQPGLYQSFVALPSPSTHIIRAHGAQPSTIVIDELIDTIQVYRADLLAQTIAIHGQVMPHIVSKIIGKSHHCIYGLTIRATGDIADVMPMLFCTPIHFDEGISIGITDKAWFIATCTIGDQVYTGVVVHKGFLKRGVRELTILYRDAGKTLYKIQIPYAHKAAKQQIAKKRTITESEYSRMLEEIYYETMPGPAALAEALEYRVQESVESAMLKTFGNLIGTSLKILSQQTMVQHDIAALGRSEISVQTYINYVAYNYDQDYIQELVHAAINHNHIESQDIDHLLSCLADNEQHGLISIYTDMLAQRAKHDIVLLQSIPRVLDYLVQRDLALHATYNFHAMLLALQKALHMPTTNEQKQLVAMTEHAAKNLIDELVKKSWFDLTYATIAPLFSIDDIVVRGLGLILANTLPTIHKNSLLVGRLVAHNNNILRELCKAAYAGDSIAGHFYQEAIAIGCAQA